MIDVNKVINGLEVIKQFFEYGLPSTAEMFDSYYGILNDAQKLLKEQETEIERLKGELHGFGDLFHALSEKTKKAMAEQPNIVQCKDCVWFRSGLDIDGKPFVTCVNTKHIRVYGGTEQDFYCGYAERKDGEQNETD